MAKVVIDKEGIKQYRNKNGDFHREDGPAVIWPCGTSFYWVDGKPSQTYFPTSWWAKGKREWWSSYSTLISIGRPAVDNPNGHKEWHNDLRQIWPELE